MLFATLDPTTRKLNLPRVVKPVPSGAAASVPSAKDYSVDWVSDSGVDDAYTTVEWLSSTPQDTPSSSAEATDVATDATTTPTPSTETVLSSPYNPTSPTPSTTSTNKKPQSKLTYNSYETSDISKGKEIFLTDTVGFISKLPTDLIAAFRATLEEVKNADILIHVCDRSSPVWKKQRTTVLKELNAIGCYDIPIIELWNKIDMLDDPIAVMNEVRIMMTCVLYTLHVYERCICICVYVVLIVYICVV